MPPAGPNLKSGCRTPEGPQQVGTAGVAPEQAGSERGSRAEALPAAAESTAPQPLAATPSAEQQEQGGAGLASPLSAVSTLTTPDRQQLYCSPPVLPTAGVEVRPGSAGRPRLTRLTVVNAAWSPSKAQGAPSAALSPLRLAFDGIGMAGMNPGSSEGGEVGVEAPAPVLAAAAGGPPALLTEEVQAAGPAQEQSAGQPAAPGQQPAAAVGVPAACRPATAPAAAAAEGTSAAALAASNKRQAALERLKQRTLQRKCPERPATALAVVPSPAEQHPVAGSRDLGACVVGLGSAGIAPRRQYADENCTAGRKGRGSSGGSSLRGPGAALARPGSAGRPAGSRIMQRSDTALVAPMADEADEGSAAAAKPPPQPLLLQTDMAVEQPPQQQRGGEGGPEGSAGVTPKPFLRRRSQAVAMHKVPDFSQVKPRTVSGWDSPRSQDGRRTPGRKQRAGAGLPLTACTSTSSHGPHMHCCVCGVSVCVCVAGGSRGSTPTSSRGSTPRTAPQWQPAAALSRFAVPQQELRPGSVGSLAQATAAAAATAGSKRPGTTGAGSSSSLRPSVGASLRPPASKANLDARNTPFAPQPAPAGAAAWQGEGGLDSWQLQGLGLGRVGAAQYGPFPVGPHDDLAALLSNHVGPVEVKTWPAGPAPSGARRPGLGRPSTRPSRPAAGGKQQAADRAQGSGAAGQAAGRASAAELEGEEGPLDSLLFQVNSLLQEVEKAIR